MHKIYACWMSLLMPEIYVLNKEPMGVTMTFQSEHNCLYTLLSPFHCVKKNVPKERNTVHSSAKILHLSYFLGQIVQEYQYKNISFHLE